MALPSSRDRHRTVGTRHGQGISRIVIGIIDAQVEKDRRDSIGWTKSTRCRAPAAIAVVFGDESVISLWQPFKARESMLHSQELVRLTGKWSGQCHHLIAMRNLCARIAPIESLGPNQTSVVERLPLHASRSSGHALAGNIVTDRQVGNSGDRLARSSPYLGLTGEIDKRHSIREWAAHRADQDVLLIGR